ncbi:MAG TPA: DUF1054 family protein [Methylomirabilota bacterium]|nr:DUF1054 family protein [Methylomirabilota bacterium]
MEITPFVPADFRVFARPGFAERMVQLRAKVPPTLERLGQVLAGPLRGAP